MVQDEFGADQAVERWRGRYLPHVVAAALYVGMLLAAGFKELQELGRNVFAGWIRSVRSSSINLCKRKRHHRKLIYKMRRSQDSIFVIQSETMPDNVRK